MVEQWMETSSWIRSTPASKVNRLNQKPMLIAKAASKFSWNPYVARAPECLCNIWRDLPGTPTAKQKELTQYDALLRLQSTLPLFRHVLFDAGNCAATAAHYLRMPTNISTTIALGMGGMGYAIAGAIGVQLGETSACRTLVIGGDGAFMMTGLEIHTAVDLQLPILWVIFNNNQHGMCVTRQRLYFDGRIEGNTYSALDIAQITRGFGSTDTFWSASAQSPDGLQQALTEYLARKPGPGVLELKISNDELPPFRSFLSAQVAML